MSKTQCFCVGKKSKSAPDYIFFFWQTQQRDKLELSTCVMPVQSVHIWWDKAQRQRAVGLYGERIVWFKRWEETSVEVEKKKNCACLCWVEESLSGRACNAFGEESTSISARSLGLRRIKGFVCLHNKMHNFGKKNGERWDSTGRYEMGKLMRRRRVYVSHSLTFLILRSLEVPKWANPSSHSLIFLLKSSGVSLFMWFCAVDIHSFTWLEVQD